MRLEFTEAVQASLWNNWFVLAYTVPLVLVLVASIKPRGGCMISPFALLVFLVLYYFGIEEWDRVIVESAVTDEEAWYSAADTGRTFAPLFRGVPLGVGYIAFCIFGGSFLGAYVRYRARLKRKAAIVSIPDSDTKEDSDNPYSPPSVIR